MINPFNDINWNPNAKDIRAFGKSVLIGFVMIGLLFLLVGLFRQSFIESIKLPIMFVAIGVAIWVGARFAPKQSLPLYYVWFGVSACIGIVISNLILIMFYYLFFSVFAVLFRFLTGRDPLMLKKPFGKPSYWHEYSKNGNIKRYLKQY